MRLGGKSRAGITLTLGLLVGIVLVILPGILALPTPNSSSTGSDTRGPTQSFTTASSNKNTQPTTTTPTVSAMAGIVTLAGLILIPAIALSVLVRHWTLKRARSRNSSDQFPRHERGRIDKRLSYLIRLFLKQSGQIGRFAYLNVVALPQNLQGRAIGRPTVSVLSSL